MRRTLVTIALVLVLAPRVGLAEEPADATDPGAAPSTDQGAPPGKDEGAAPGDATRMGEVVVHGRAEDLVGTAESASEGYVGHEELESRPLLRPAEMLETVPGLIATQHSGGGKANQYFLRGFNLDHGTDLATGLDDIPLNLPSHGHGQGYTDLNFLIPELVQYVTFRKGPYYADRGDFASAGAFDFHYFDVLPAAIVKGEGGEFNYGRVLVADSPELGTGHLLYALEGLFNGGPWEHSDDLYHVNGLLRWSTGDVSNGFSLTGIGYHANWNSTDQVAVRAIKEGLIGKFDALDPSDAGKTSRYSLSGEWHAAVGPGRLRVPAYAYYYDLDLFSNFTYFLDDPVRGDQFEQKDSRGVFGATPSYQWSNEWLGKTFANTAGIQLRSDLIHNGLYSTEKRNRFHATRHDHIDETSAAAYLESQTAWTDWFRTTVGGRVDVFDFQDDASLQVNSNGKTDAIASPKVSLVFGPWYQTELYLNGGYGFHSNDARGVAGRIDPKTGDPVEEADPLVRSKGAEVGVRTAALPNLQSTVSLWLLDIDSELLFVGDAGTNEPSRPSRRYGLEFANYYSPLPWLTLDGDVSFSHAKFTKHDPEGDHIPGSVDAVIAAGIAVHDLHGFFGSLRLRYFGPRPLIEDNSVRSKDTTLVNLEAGYAFNEHMSLAIDVFNLFDARPSDIDYFYTSRLPGEPAEGVDDVHTHPAEPRAIRASFTYTFGRK